MASDGGHDRQRSAPGKRKCALAPPRRADDADGSGHAQGDSAPRPSRQRRRARMVGGPDRCGRQHHARLHARGSRCDRRAGQRRAAHRLSAARWPHRAPVLAATRQRRHARPGYVRAGRRNHPLSRAATRRRCALDRALAAFGRRRHPARRSRRRRAGRRQCDRALARAAMTPAAISAHLGARATQQGLALIIAMLIAALAAAVAVSVATAQSQWLAEVGHRRDQVEAQSIALAGLQWARAIVDADARGIDHLGEPWALPLPATPVENGDVEGRIVDAQAMLNVNELATAHGPLERRRFTRLFAALGIPETTLAAIVDWVDADNVPQQGGAEDAWYLGEADASLAANGPATRIEELALVRGMTVPSLARIAPFVTSLPPGAPVNVNTAAPEVLAALLDNID